MRNRFGGHNRSRGCRVTEFIHKGYRCISLENEQLRVTVIADKGADILEFLYKPLDLDFLWRSPQGLRPASQFPGTTPRQAGPHMDYYEGGWQELFPNCGAASLHQGAEVGQHGEVLMLPWEYTVVTDEPELIEVRFEVRTVRTPFHLSRTMSLRKGHPALFIREIVVNESGQDVDFTWGHHPAFGAPFIEPDCIVSVPNCTVTTFAGLTPATSRLAPDQETAWPGAVSNEGSQLDLSVIPSPDEGVHDMVFLTGIEDGWYAVSNPSLNAGFALKYPAHIFKVLWYWQVYGGGRDYPWWSNTYNMALEPCASMPILSKATERGEALTLDAGGSLEIEMVALAFKGSGRVEFVTDEGEVGF